MMSGGSVVKVSMSKNIIDVKAGRLFPLQFIILGGIFLFAGIVVVVTYPITAMILIVLGLFIVTAYEGTQIDPFSRTYREYNSFLLFLKSGQTKKYTSLQGIAIHRAKVSQKMFTPRTMNSSIFTHIEYNMYLKTGEDKIFLMGGRDKVKLLEKARSIAGFLNTPVSDHAMFP